MKYYVLYCYPYEPVMTEEFDTLEQVKIQIKEIEDNGWLYVHAIYHGTLLTDEEGELK